MHGIVDKVNRAIFPFSLCFINKFVASFWLDYQFVFGSKDDERSLELFVISRDFFHVLA